MLVRLVKLNSHAIFTHKQAILTHKVVALNKEDNIFSESVPDLTLLGDIRQIIVDGRQAAYTAVNAVITNTYWKIGQRIIEEEQQGKVRAEYGKNLLNTLAESLSLEFGSNYNARNLAYYKKFYLCFPDLSILNARVQNLSWTHFRAVLRESNAEARIWYLNEAANEAWSSRTLERNIGSQYYHRLLASHDTKPVVAEMQKLTAPTQADKLEFIKNPVVAEFLGFSNNSSFTESQLEQSILDHLQKFLMELGKGYAFVARQQHIATDAGDYFIDLVFYNYILKCFVLIDLKTTQITHQDVGQMDMYVRMFDDLKRSEGDNPTIGILLCSETSHDIARYSVLHDNDQLFAAKYLTYLPTPEQLRTEIEQQKEIFRLQQEK